MYICRVIYPIIEGFEREIIFSWFLNLATYEQLLELCKASVDNVYYLKSSDEQLLTCQTTHNTLLCEYNIGQVAHQTFHQFIYSYNMLRIQRNNFEADHNQCL